MGFPCARFPTRPVTSLLEFAATRFVIDASDATGYARTGHIAIRARQPAV